MNKQEFLKQIEEIEKEYEDWDLNLCETVQDMVNWSGNFVTLLNTTRIFFFESTQTVVLVDSPNGYIKHFSMPEDALEEIQGWLDTIKDQHDYDVAQSEQLEREEEIYYELLKQND